MIEGLWTVRFLEPRAEEFDLNGGVVVIETGRILGGDSGYVYLGEIVPSQANAWSVKLKIRRHDPNIYSIFGDLDEYELAGIAAIENGHEGSASMLVQLRNPSSPITLIVRMVKVAELP